jgi:cytochrome c5
VKRPLKSINRGAVLLADDRERRVLSRKELAREQRRAIYQRVKEWRATDPRHLAMKEAAKQQQRATYQQVKVQRKAVAAAKKAKRKAERALQRSDNRTESDRELKALVTWMAKGSTAQN